MYVIPHILSVLSSTIEYAGGLGKTNVISSYRLFRDWSHNYLVTSGLLDERLLGPSPSVDRNLKIHAREERLT